jgi:hypothetical protein
MPLLNPLKPKLDGSSGAVSTTTNRWFCIHVNTGGGGGIPTGFHVPLYKQPDLTRTYSFIACLCWCICIFCASLSFKICYHTSYDIRNSFKSCKLTKFWWLTTSFVDSGTATGGLPHPHHIGTPIAYSSLQFLSAKCRSAIPRITWKK